MREISKPVDLPSVTIKVIVHLNDGRSLVESMSYQQISNRQRKSCFIFGRLHPLTEPTPTPLSLPQLKSEAHLIEKISKRPGAAKLLIGLMPLLKLYAQYKTGRSYERKL